MFRVVALLLVLSGTASLIYQVTWVRLLGLSMGATSAAVSTVVSAFFAGLGLGSFLARRRWARASNQLRIYLMLEGIIGVSGLLSLPLLLHLDRVVFAIPWLGASGVVKFVVSFAVLAIPTLCMGATFPVMARVLVRSGTEIGRRLSELYAFNTLGAVLGAILAGFVLVPRFGLDGAIVTAALLNATLVVVGLLLGSERDVRTSRRAASEEPRSNEAKTKPSTAPRNRGALLAVSVTGFVSIAAEIGWTKYLVMFVGSTLYGFSAVLASYLTGIALGSWVARRRVDRLRAPSSWLALGLGVLSVALLSTRSGFLWLPDVQGALLRHAPAAGFEQLVRYLVVFVLLLPSTVLLGALFPLSLKTYCSTRAEVQTRIGEAYAVNTVAGILGAVVAGFFWIPTWGTHHLLTYTALFPLAALPAFSHELRRANVRWGAAGLATGALLLVVASKPLDLQSLVDYVRLDRAVVKEQKVLFSKEGRTGLVSVATFRKDRVNLYNDGLNEATIHLTDPYRGTLVETMLGMLPYLMHEDPKRAFVIGLGGGVTMRALSHAGLESVRVAELEPVVAEALTQVVGAHGAGLDDPKVQIDFDDARHLLLVENTHYDIVVSQPSHPWCSGAGNLFTEEFFRLSAERLTANGIHAQWVNLFRMDVTTLKAILRSFAAVFPHVASFAWRRNLLLLGSKAPLVFRPEQMQERMGRGGVKRTLDAVGYRAPYQVLALFALSRQDIVSAVDGGPHSTDSNLLPEVRLARLRKDPSGAEDPMVFLKKHASFDVLRYVPQAVQGQWLERTAWLLRNKGRFLTTPGRVIQRLQSIDPAAAQALRRELGKRGR